MNHGPNSLLIGCLDQMQFPSSGRSFALQEISRACSLDQLADQVVSLCFGKDFEWPNSYRKSFESYSAGHPMSSTVSG